MYAFHKDKKRYFDIQKKVTADHIIPFLESNDIKVDQVNILEIGCAEAGVLEAFLERGCQCIGIELSEGRANLARQFHANAINEKRIDIISKNIHDIDINRDLDGKKFDIIVLKDVIEHIFDRSEFMDALHRFLNSSGVVFFAFPPWQMPFGGHQQICKSKFFQKLPYFHLLPVFAYKAILKFFGERERTIEGLLEIKETQISIGQFEALSLKNDYTISATCHYLFNPIYEHKFGLKPRKQLNMIKYIPYLRNFITTGVYYIIKSKKYD